MIDWTSQWPEVAPLSSISADDCIPSSEQWHDRGFHSSLKSALRSQLAGLDSFLHLPLVLLGLRTVPKDDTGLSVSKAVYGPPLTIPGEFFGSPELPPSSFLQKIENDVAGFAVPLPHHVQHSLPLQLPPALLATVFVFVREDATIPSLAPLYQGPYLVLERKDKYFSLQLGSRMDVVTVDRLKPGYSEDPIQAVLPPARSWLALCLDLLAPDPPPSSTSTAIPARSSVKKRVRFKIPPPVPARRNPHWSVRDRRTCSAISPRFFLGGVLWRQSVPEFLDHNSTYSR